MRCALLPSFEYRRERWQNGLGWTREILRDAPANWGFRCSVAEIDHDGRFSSFPGRQRLMVLLQGEGLQLHCGDGSRIDLSPPHGRASYPGDMPIEARLIDGPCHAFNLIHDPDRFAVEVLHRPLVGPMVFFEEAQVSWLIYVLSGQAGDRQPGQAPLARSGDSLLLSAEAGSGGRLLLDGAGELLLVRLQALGPPPGEAPEAP